MNENQFWMVYIEGDGIIDDIEYDNFNEARLAAEELLSLPRHCGQKAYILSPCSCGVSHPSVVWDFPGDYPGDCGAATEEEK